MTEKRINIETLFDFAIRLEEMGEKFFLEWAEKTENEELRAFFKLMAEEENKHKKTFETLKEKANVIKDKNVQIQDEYSDYIKSFSNTILSNEKEMKTVETLQSAIQLAKKQEVDAQLFFSLIMVYVSDDHMNVVQKLVEEEREHFKKLSILENKIFNTQKDIVS